MAYLINISPDPNQEFECVLNGQRCIIHVFQRGGRVFLDLTADGTEIIKGAICRNDTDILQYRHAGFLGNLRFLDTVNSRDPEYTGIGKRYHLYYIPEDEAEELNNED